MNRTAKSSKARPPRSNSKLQDVGEFTRWYEQGWTYKDMVEEYQRKYSLEVSIAMFSGWRKRLGLRPRLVPRSDTLLPWDVREEHNWLTLMRTLQTEARLRAGAVVSLDQTQKVSELKAKLTTQGLVVHYEPDTHEGFWLVPARPGIDTDMVRVPDAEAV